MQTIRIPLLNQPLQDLPDSIQPDIDITVEQKNQSCEFRAGSQICHSWPLTEFKNINKKIYKLTEATPIDF